MSVTARRIASALPQATTPLDALKTIHLTALTEFFTVMTHMGGYKKAMERIEDLANSTAMEIAISAGARSRCEDCDGTSDEGSWENVPPLVAELYAQGSPVVEGVDPDALATALEWLKQNGDSLCPCQSALEREP